MEKQNFGIKVIVVSPKYQQNVGYIARISANFGIKNLEFISPRCNVLGKTAIKYSKAARPLLESAKITGSFEKAVKGTFSIATTGIWRKGSAATGSLYTVESAKKIALSSKAQYLSIVIGRDDTGLKKEEIEKCDIVAFIPANPDYPVLNISHALGIMLYLFTKGAFHENYLSFKSAYASQEDKDSISRLFRLFVNKNVRIKNKEEVAESFKRVIEKSHPTKKELNSIAVAISPRGKG